MSFYSEGVKTVEQPGQFPGVNAHDLSFGNWPAEYVALQPLLPQAKAVAIPVEQLNDGPTAVAKTKQMAGERIKLQLLRNQEGEAINAPRAR